MKQILKDNKIEAMLLCVVALIPAILILGFAPFLLEGIKVYEIPYLIGGVIILLIVYTLMLCMAIPMIVNAWNNTVGDLNE